MKKSNNGLLISLSVVFLIFTTSFYTPDKKDKVPDDLHQYTLLIEKFVRLDPYNITREVKDSEETIKCKRGTSCNIIVNNINEDVDGLNEAFEDAFSRYYPHKYKVASPKSLSAGDYNDNKLYKYVIKRKLGYFPPRVNEEPRSTIFYYIQEIETKADYAVISFNGYGLKSNILKLARKLNDLSN